MAEAMEKLQELKGGNADVQKELPKPQIDAKGRTRATGKRKTSVARVTLQPGKGEIIVNGRKLADYFGRPVLQMMVREPFEVTNRLGEFDVTVRVNGGGLSGQAGAVRHGISKALALREPELRKELRQIQTGPGGISLLTRDPRVVERKKYGKKKARRSFQFSKR